ncbi:unnamed protein product [Thlaspi arvense]|uniref:Protein kinase domain-containing protein n=1 Tax=Thlaspi arvense TaxID=13288 RepID=A0AAU9S1E8_THLAR|nr:unnamed protein product [Thlaspi arvense]
MAVKKKISWRSLVAGCLGDPETIMVPSKKPKSKDDVIKKQSSFQRLSILDLSNPSSTTLSEDLSISLAGSDLHKFSLAELKVITQSFSSTNFLGEGGFGPVHKGFVDDKLRPGLKAQPVAVKLLDLEGLQGHREWLVRYSASLPWSTRMKIAHGAATGLQFLHDAENPVIYRDFKASNILLDSVSKKPSDVYSFGVVLLELLTGRRSVDKKRSSREQNLVDWARPMLNDARKLSRIMDPRLEGQYSETGAKKAATLAYQCLSHRPKNRPCMSAVVSILNDLKDYNDIPMGTFTYTVPNTPEKSLSDNREDEGRVRESNKPRKSHHHRESNHHPTAKSLTANSPRTKSPTANSPRTKSPTAESPGGGNHRRTLRNGLNSPMRSEAGGERY